MKQIRKFANKVAMVLAFSLLSASCSQYDDDAVLESRDQAKYSGEELFKGLFFFQNDIAENIVHLKDIKSSITKLKYKNEIEKSLTDMSSISVNFINMKYPSFFKELEDVLYSGNRFEIQKKMNLSVKMIEQALLTSKKYSSILKIGKEVASDKVLMEKVMNVDVTNEKGQLEMQKILSENSTYKYVEEAIAVAVVVFVVGALAIAYTIAGAVSAVVTAYSVVTEVVYWVAQDSSLEASKLYTEKSLKQEIIIDDLSNFLLN
jgi:SdpC family antimicrobial peptide